jgi:hypothetical protein
MGTFRLSKLRRQERGQSLVEMALAMILFLLLLVGVVDFGRAFNNYIIITNASREGARYASRFPHDDAGIRARTVQEADNFDLDPPLGPLSDVAVDFPDGADEGGYRVQVIVTYQFETIMTGLVSAITGNPNLRLQVGTTMVIFGLD